MTDTATAETDTAPERSWTSADRLAALTFAVALAVAFVTFLTMGRRNWFFLDEWDFLADRSVTSVDDLTRPHNEHWSTLPIIVYRAMYWVFGLRSYVPYVLLVVVLHLTAATLLRVVMRRAGVHPWLATAAAGMFLFLGSGFQNIVWAFQIGFVGSLVCGLAHLILSDHDGEFDRRDAIGLLFGLAALMCSGVGVTMVATVGLAVLLRRGWRMAALHTAPLGAAFLVWWVTVGRDAYSSTVRPTPRGLVEYVGTALGHAVREAGSLTVVGVALVVVLLGGCGLALVDGIEGGWRRAAAPFALVGGSVLFLTIAGMGRAGIFGLEAARISRYVHLVFAMLVPAIAVGANAIARRWPVALPFLAVLLVLGIPGNLAEINGDSLEVRILRGDPAFVKTLPLLDVATEVPRSTVADRGVYPYMTIGWLVDGNRSGRIPDPDRINETIAGIGRTRLLLEQVRVVGKPTGCTQLTGNRELELTEGQSFRVLGGDVRVRVTAKGRTGPPTRYTRPRNSAIVARADLTAIVMPFRSKPLVCGP